MAQTLEVQKNDLGQDKKNHLHIVAPFQLGIQILSHTSMPHGSKIEVWMHDTETLLCMPQVVVIFLVGGMFYDVLFPKTDHS